MSSSKDNKTDESRRGFIQDVAAGAAGVAIAGALATLGAPVVAAAQEKKEEKMDDTQKPPLPEVNFNSLIFSLSSSAFLHIGDIADPQTGEKKKDLPMAKHSIDIIAMLKDKTKGNLTEEEQKFLDNILADLRLRYVKAIK